jgi:hypothetical protein
LFRIKWKHQEIRNYHVFYVVVAILAVDRLLERNVLNVRLKVKFQFVLVKLVILQVDLFQLLKTFEHELVQMQHFVVLKRQRGQIVQRDERVLIKTLYIVVVQIQHFQVVQAVECSRIDMCQVVVAQVQFGQVLEIVERVRLNRF